MLKFQEMPDTVLEHFKGGEGSTITKMFADDLNRIFIGRLQPGDCSYCKKGGTHTLMNKGEADLVFFAVVPQQ